MSTTKRGFASMNPEKRKEIQSLGGKTLSKNKKHMEEIGRKGGIESGRIRAAKNNVKPFYVWVPILLLSLCSCAQRTTPVKEFDAGFVRMKKFDYGRGITITTIDSCQYIILEGDSDYNIIHKANCKNPKH